jgi:hypothetical protein
MQPDLYLSTMSSESKLNKCKSPEYYEKGIRFLCPVWCHLYDHISPVTSSLEGSYQNLVLFISATRAPRSANVLLDLITFTMSQIIASRIISSFHCLFQASLLLQPEQYAYRNRRRWTFSLTETPAFRLSISEANRGRVFRPVFSQQSMLSATTPWVHRMSRLLSELSRWTVVSCILFLAYFRTSWGKRSL